MRYFKQYLLSLVFILFSCVHLNAQITEMWDKTISNQQQSEKTKWFEDAKFGLFVHWGLFAQHAGEWNSKRYYGVSEWVMFRGKIPVADYRKQAQVFNPSKFNADEWVKLANGAGIKYMVITAKHHEGFAMFDSKVSDYNIMNTPFKRDPMKELSAACKKGNVKMGFYYSQFLDWNEPNGGGARVIADSHASGGQSIGGLTQIGSNVSFINVKRFLHSGQPACTINYACTDYSLSLIHI